MTNWIESKLGDVILEMRNGVNCKQDKSGVGDKITRIETIADAAFNLERVGYSQLSDKEKEKYNLIRGDILFSHINSVVHVGKTAILNQDVDIYHGVNLMLFRPHNFMLPEFLQYFLKMIFNAGYWRTICKQSVNQASVNQTDIKKVPINYPSLPEQKRIVAILDEAFAGIDQAIANTERNLASARELFESYLNTIFTQKGDGWENKKLGEVAYLAGRIGWKGLTAKEYTQEGPLFISVHALNYGDYIDYKQAFHITQERYDESPEIMLKTDDVLICKDGAGIGKMGIVGKLPAPATINSSLLLIRALEGVKPKYLYYLLCGPVFQKLVQERIDGATTPHLYQREIKELPVVIPPEQAQGELIKEIDSVNQNIKDLVDNYKLKLASLNELKQSLLQKAFSGELTADMVGEIAEAAE